MKRGPFAERPESPIRRAGYLLSQSARGLSQGVLTRSRDSSPALCRPSATPRPDLHASCRDLPLPLQPGSFEGIASAPEQKTSWLNPPDPHSFGPYPENNSRSRNRELV